MQQFVVPQFIDVEDKILGPVTIRQFLIMLAGGLVIFISYKLADFVLFVITLALVGGGSLILAFVKVNGQDFHYFLLNITQTLRKPGMRVWNKEYSKKELEEFRVKEPEVFIAEKKRKQPRQEHIRDLSLVVNTGGYYQPELQQKPDESERRR